MVDNKIKGRAKKYDGTAIDYVSIFNWNDGTCIAQVSPDASGTWSHRVDRSMRFGVTYIADGCEPITHGAYDFEVLIPTDTILHYSFDGSLLDSSTNSLNGIKTGNANFVAGRKAGTQAMEFVNGCVRTPIALPIKSDKLTISFWISTSQSSTAVVLEASDNVSLNANSFSSVINDLRAKNLQSAMKGAASASASVFLAPVSMNNTYQHIIIEIDRSLPTMEEHKIYVNNVLSSTKFNQDAVSISGNFADYITYIGQRNAKSYPFVGKLQDMRFYNRILSEAERTLLFNE